LSRNHERRILVRQLTSQFHRVVQVGLLIKICHEVAGHAYIVVVSLWVVKVQAPVREGLVESQVDHFVVSADMRLVGSKRMVANLEWICQFFSCAKIIFQILFILNLYLAKHLIAPQVAQRLIV
jgi:hypothetical protein